MAHNTFCTNYKALNGITIKHSVAIPTVYKLFGATYFSKLDLRFRYHQILVKLKDRFILGFRTHQGALRMVAYTI